MADSSSLTSSRTAWWRAHPIAATFATIGLLATLAGTTVILHKVGLIEFDLLQFFYESDEAPIRVRNGSVELELLSSNQEWEQVGGSPNWKIPGTRKFKDEYTVWLIVSVTVSNVWPGAMTAGVRDSSVVTSAEASVR
jgi:hypothetical protein